MRYEIIENTVYIFNNNDQCFVEQPFHPDKRDWFGIDEMNQWANDFITNFQEQEILSEEARLAALAETQV